jgi:hypothetical protein
LSFSISHILSHSSFFAAAEGRRNLPLNLIRWKSMDAVIGGFRNRPPKFVRSLWPFLATVEYHRSLPAVSVNSNTIGANLQLHLDNIKQLSLNAMHAIFM